MITGLIFFFCVQPLLRDVLLVCCVSLFCVIGLFAFQCLGRFVVRFLRFFCDLSRSACAPLALICVREITCSSNSCLWFFDFESVFIVLSDLHVAFSVLMFLCLQVTAIC